MISCATVTMSTAFLVDNILNSKDNTVGCVEDSIASDSESETNSDLKYSLCDSPNRNEMLLSRNSSISSHEDSFHISEDHHLHLHNFDQRKSAFGMLQRAPGHLDADEVGDGRAGDRIELCCNICGHFSQIINIKNLTSNEIIRRENEFKCDKCCGRVVVIDNGGVGGGSEGSGDNDINGDTDVDGDDALRVTSIGLAKERSNETMLKDGSKPILKFSVSAILGDTREGVVRVRNGKKINC